MTRLRLPFFYGWVVVAIAFVTMAIGVNTRTAFSLLFPPMLEEFGWDRGITAGAFSIGFLASVISAPFTGFIVDRYGPRVAIPLGAVLVASGLSLATLAKTPFHVYMTLGVLCVGGSVFISYIGHSSFLPNWFVRRRGLAIGIAFSGVGVASIVLMPMLQSTIDQEGWRSACLFLAALTVLVIIPINVLFQRRRPEDIGLQPDGHIAVTDGRVSESADNVVDKRWADTDWTLGLAMRTRRYWWCALGYFTALYAWYAVQVHQTKVLIDLQFSSTQAAFALGLVGLTGIIGQISIGSLSDRIGREWGWTMSCLGYVICYALLIQLERFPVIGLAYAMAAIQGLLGYGIAPLFSSIGAELFQGRRFGVIFGSLSVWSGLGAGAGPWLTGVFYDARGNYDIGFSVALAAALVSMVSIWMAGPGRVRMVGGRAVQRRDLLRRKHGVIANAAVIVARESDRGNAARLQYLAITPTPIRVIPGQRAELHVHAFDSRGRSIENSIEFSWRLTGETGWVEELGTYGRKALLRIHKNALPGNLQVSTLGLEQNISVERQIEII